MGKSDITTPPLDVVKIARDATEMRLLTGMGMDDLLSGELDTAVQLCNIVDRARTLQSTKSFYVANYTYIYVKYLQWATSHRNRRLQFTELTILATFSSTKLNSGLKSLYEVTLYLSLIHI